MLIYFILLAAVAAAGIPLCGKKCGRWGKAVYCAVFALAFTVISAVRFQVGYDYNSYGGTYFNMMYSGMDDIMAMRMEKGFIMPLYILNLAFEDYWVVFIYTSIIFYFSVFGLIYKNSSSPWMSAAAFLCFGAFFNSLCFLRQFMAAIIITYAVRYVCEKNPAMYFIFVAAASAFHWSALIMAALYFLLIIKPSWIYLGIVTAGTILFCIFSHSAMMFAIDKFDMYSAYNPDTNPEASIGLSPKFTIVFGLAFLICFLFRKRLIEKNPCNGVYINCLMFTAVFEAMGMRHAILSRFALLTYLPPILYLFPDAVKAIGEFAAEKKGKIALWSAYAASAAAAVASYVLLIASNYNGVVPYTSQFNRPYDIFVEVKATEEDEDFDEEDYEDEDFDEDDYEDEDYDEDGYDYEDYDEDSGGEDGKIVIDELPDFQ